MYIRSENDYIDSILPRVKTFFDKSETEYDILGKKVTGYRDPDAPSTWIRSVADTLRAYKYWKKDLKGVVEIFAETQSSQGWLFDYFTTSPEKVPCERENWVKFVRVPNEADVEFRFIKAVYQVWQATGDDEWLLKMLPAMEKAINYVLTDPLRWDKKTGLVKRPYTIDTWDFDYTAGRHPWLNFQITDNTYWGIMHGDNSGYYEAFCLLSKIYEGLGNRSKSNQWSSFARKFRSRANNICFNGRFYTHHVPIVPVKIEGVDVSEQLSLSNPMDINRGLATHQMAVSILKEYQNRRTRGKAFAEWFSIDPPFPAGIFGDDRIIEGAYCNGGIMPLVGGELARAAFEHGMEGYGVDILKRYSELTSNGQSFLWYFPDGRHATLETSTSPDASPYDTWGGSSMLYALVEGLAGVVDTGKLFESVNLSPRWIAADSEKAEVVCGYEASGKTFEYKFEHDKSSRQIILKIQSPSKIYLHLLLPPGSRAKSLSINGRSAKFENKSVYSSRYVDAICNLRKKGELRIKY